MNKPSSNPSAISNGLRYLDDRGWSAQINTSIKYNGFSEHTLQLIDNYINDILNGRTNLDRFNLPEHAGLCTAGAPLIGAYIVCNYARTSLEPGRDAEPGQDGPSNWQIDELQIGQDMK